MHEVDPDVLYFTRLGNEFRGGETKHSLVLRQHMSHSDCLQSSCEAPMAKKLHIAAGNSMPSCFVRTN